MPSWMQVLAAVIGGVLLGVGRAHRRALDGAAPVLGHADDAVVVAIALRSATRRAGPEALERHWPGTPDGLVAIRRLAGIPTS